MCPHFDEPHMPFDRRLGWGLVWIPEILRKQVAKLYQNGARGKTLRSVSVAPTDPKAFVVQQKSHLKNNFRDGMTRSGAIYEGNKWAMVSKPPPAVP